MFIGHFGVGFGAKRWAPRASLGTLILAAQLLDLVWPTLVLAGVERSAGRARRSGCSWPGVTGSTGTGAPAHKEAAWRLSS